MRTLVVDDDFTSRVILEKAFHPYGDVDMVADGEEAVQAARVAIGQGEPYDLICLDIMMPGVDGRTALHRIREVEEKSGILMGKGAKVAMTTALNDSRNIFGSFREQCDFYMVKPIDLPKLKEFLRGANLIT